ncbi:transposase, partial [Burkholderia contaminans]|nr:transposase [Burkholderia contaminans]
MADGQQRGTQGRPVAGRRRDDFDTAVRACRLAVDGPLDFIARLAALVPKPRVNLTRFHGVFAPNSRHRALVTPAKRG